VIEKDAEKCERIEDELGDICLLGNASEMAILNKAGVVRADVLIAVTNEDEDNLATCQVAKQKFNVPRVIARVNAPRNEKIFTKLGVECTIDSAALVTEHIKAETFLFPLIHLFTIKDLGLEIVLIRVSENSAAVGKPIEGISLPSGSAISLLIRPEQAPQIPTPDTVLNGGDQLICLVPIENVESLQAIFEVS
jgi:trk system potassium uptake protein TrkA